MDENTDNKRKFPRYETDVKVHFVLPYDFRAEVDFSLTSDTPESHPPKYIGFSKNISVQGLCFESNKEVSGGDALWLELHLPNSKEIIYMQGLARWCQLLPAGNDGSKTFLIGAEVKVVDGADVEQTVYFDEQYHLMWSALLDRVLGSFAKSHKKKI